jgi:D-alanyl-D-alanine dipeptidase
MRIASLLFALLSPALASAHPFDGLAGELARTSGLVDVSAWEGIDLDVRYATANNFTQHDVYGPFQSCFLREEAAAKLRRASEALRTKRPGWKLRVFDCLRPARAQAALYAVVRGTPDKKYVVSPHFGSLHSYGFAIDLSLEDENGREVDMGSEFDFFGIEAEPRHEDELLRSGKLSWTQVANRQLLRGVMRSGGWRSISTEWWHFEALAGKTVREKFRPVP